LKLLDDVIDFDKYRTPYDTDTLKLHEEHFFNFALWYLAYDVDKDQSLFATDLNPDNRNPLDRLINVGTSYLQLFFDYKLLIEDYKVNYHGIKYSKVHYVLPILSKRIPALLKNNSSIISDFYTFDFDNIKDAPNHFVFSDKQGGIKYKDEIKFNPLNIFPILNELKNEPKAKQELLAYKRLLLNPSFAISEYQFFHAFNIHDDVSLKANDHPIIINSLKTFASPYIKSKAVKTFNRFAELTIKYYVLRLMEYNFSIQNELDFSIIVSGPTEHVRQHLFFIIEIFEEYDISNLTEILYSLAWKKLPDGKLNRLNKDAIRRIIQREIENIGES